MHKNPLDISQVIERFKDDKDKKDKKKPKKEYQKVPSFCLVNKLTKLDSPEFLNQYGLKVKVSSYSPMIIMIGDETYLAYRKYYLFFSRPIFAVVPFYDFQITNVSYSEMPVDIRDKLVEEYKEYLEIVKGETKKQIYHIGGEFKGDVDEIKNEIRQSVSKLSKYCEEMEKLDIERKVAEETDKQHIIPSLITEKSILSHKAYGEFNVFKTLFRKLNTAVEKNLISEDDALKFLQDELKVNEIFSKCGFGYEITGG